MLKSCCHSLEKGNPQKIKKIINQIKNELNLNFIAFSAVLEVIFLSVLLLFGYLFYINYPKIKNAYAKYKICGQVLEYGSGVSIPDFKIENGTTHMYSNYLGSYCWQSLHKGEEIEFSVPYQYESSKTDSIGYSNYRELSPLLRQLEHNIYLTLGVDAAAERIFKHYVDGQHDNTWVYLDSMSKNLWSNKRSDYTKALDTERTLRSKLDRSQLSDYKIISKTNISNDEYVFKVEWYRANGSTFTRDETLVKLDDWWHYKYPRYPKEVYDFIYFAERQLVYYPSSER